MDVFDAIFGRFSSAAVSLDPIPKPQIERLLAAAVQAPNHYRVRPWRFFVLTGSGRNRLGSIMAESFLRRHPDVPPEGLEKIQALPLRAPLVIAVAVDPPAEPKVIAIENICAAAAACQNLLLAAHAEGLRAKWRTGEWASDSLVKEFFSLSPAHTIISFLYVGRAADQDALPANRPSYEDRTVWID